MEYDIARMGEWLNPDDVKNGDKVKIIEETVKQESRFKDDEGNAKTENVTKVRVQGKDKTYNMRLNWATIFGLVRAFGKESKGWIDRPLTVHTVDAMVGDTMRTMVYLIPDGFELKKNAEKKLEIVEKPAPAKIVADEEIDPADIPF